MTSVACGLETIVREVKGDLANQYPWHYRSEPMEPGSGETE